MDDSHQNMTSSSSSSSSSSPATTSGSGGGGGQHGTNSGAEFHHNFHQHSPTAAVSDESRPVSTNANHSNSNGRLSRTDSYNSDKNPMPNNAGGGVAGGVENGSRKFREFTPDERKDMHYWDRRRRNNEAAKRSREKRRLHDVALEQRLLDVINENMFLRAEIQALRDEYMIPLEAPPLVLQKPALLAAAQAAVNHAQHALQQQYNHVNNISSTAAAANVVQNNSNILKLSPIINSTSSIFTPLLAAHIGSHLQQRPSTGGATQQQQPLSLHSIGGLMAQQQQQQPTAFAMKNFFFHNNNGSSGAQQQMNVANCLSASAQNQLFQNNINALAAQLAAVHSSSSAPTSATTPTVSMHIVPPTVHPPHMTLPNGFAFRQQASAATQKSGQIFDFSQTTQQQQSPSALLLQPAMNYQQQQTGSGGPLSLPMFNANPTTTFALSANQNNVSPPSFILSKPNDVENKKPDDKNKPISSSAAAANDDDDGRLSPSTVAVNTLLQFAEGQWNGVPGGFTTTTQSNGHQQQKQVVQTAAAAATEIKTDLHQNSAASFGSSSVEEQPRIQKWPLKLRHKERTVRTISTTSTTTDVSEEVKSPPENNKPPVKESDDDTASGVALATAPTEQHLLNNNLNHKKDRRPSFQSASSKLSKFSRNKKLSPAIVKRNNNNKVPRKVMTNCRKSGKAKILKANR